ncbi:hypothetical protein BT93_D1851 [Corymbia citriodora subsp. variegata]|nr:hypothetical protein BT93_D1851 [Corymbia citriodora subsp. variegata]
MGLVILGQNDKSLQRNHVEPGSKETRQPNRVSSFCPALAPRLIRWRKLCSESRARHRLPSSTLASSMMASLLSLSSSPLTRLAVVSNHPSSSFKGGSGSLRARPCFYPPPKLLQLKSRRQQKPAPVISGKASSSPAAEPSSSPVRFRLDNLGPQPGSRKKAKRKGRGISAGQGASCGFGMRGQKSRSGPGVMKGFEGGQMPLYRRLPKLRGIAGGMHAGLPKYVPVNLRV